MLTGNRRRFVGQAIWYFLRQDYAACELIVVDDGEDPVVDLIPSDPRIHYVRVPHGLSPGAKRNRACEHCNGELIAHWDDDAWYSRQRLTAQVAQLQESRANVVALSGLLHYQPLTGRLWRYAGPPGQLAGLYSATLAYRQSFWNEHRFVESGRDEITAFIQMCPANQLNVQDGGALVVALLHGSRTAPVNSEDPRWQPRPFDELSRLLTLDLEFYASLRTNQRGVTQRLTPLPITLAGTFMVYDGYGSMAEYLALSMARAGADVQIAPFRIDPTAMSSEFLELWRRSRPNPEGIVLCHAWWGENLARFGSAQDLFVKTVWETSRLPADWPVRLNRATAVIVPSRFVARVFRESGVRVPVEVVHEGVDPNIYPYQERPERAGLTTLVVGVLAPRKNFRQAVAAWKLAFAGDRDARLILKARFQLESYVPDDPRIQLLDSNEPTRGILHWYQQADLLLALGNEGFGLPLIEGMATGLPAIALDAEAQGDVCSEAVGLVRPVRVATWEKVNASPFGPCGVRAIPDVEDAARQLRWVAAHREQAREMGRRAAAWAHAQRNVWDMGPGILAAIERHARSSRPLRRTYAVWAPTAGGGSEFEYYNGDLARSLTLAQMYADPPNAWRSQSLHIQYAPDLFDEAALVHQVEAAQQAGIAVAVTEHRVGRGAAAWEQRADVLVALSAAAVTRLRNRWPHKRVEFIPPGCLPWREARRNGEGQTIAILGLPTQECRAKELLDRMSDAMATLPAARLLVFGPPSISEADEDWGGDAHDLPVRFACLPSSSEDLARQLNEESNAVVLCGMEDGTASYTARIALASGVPVLVTPTSEYGELAAATFQPDDLAAGLREVLLSRAWRAELASAAQAFCEEASWQKVAARHLALWRTLLS
jgi:glycosyltransferase involved in cell wall biosynthesis